MSFSLIASPFINMHVNLADFMKGIGVAFMIAALYKESKKRTSATVS